MVKDLLLRIIFIPILGIGLPLISGVITYKKAGVYELIAGNIHFTITSYIIWIGCNWIHKKLRPLYVPVYKPYLKIAYITAMSSLYSICVGGLSILIWSKISNQLINASVVYKFLFACTAAVIIFTLVYEIIFLSKERELDTKIVDQLDKERSQAELLALNKEIDPHFLFNSLNTLNYLITTNPQQAYLFNNKLATVYKYFLINKNKEVVTLKEELDFVDDFFYLLQIRFENKLIFTKSLKDIDENIYLPPFSFQVLIENAIKHNEFSESMPLEIVIDSNQQYLKVSNNTKPKNFQVNSTRIGLKNLSARYRILFKKNIQIEQTDSSFSVKLPFITKTKNH